MNKRLLWTAVLCLLPLIPPGECAVQYYSTTVDPTTLHETPDGRAIGTLQNDVTVIRKFVQGEWSEIQLNTWIHVSAFKGLASPGGRLAVGAGMGMKGESSDGPQIGKIFRGSNPEMVKQAGDYIEASITAWVKSGNLRPGKAAKKVDVPSEKKPTPAAPSPPAAKEAAPPERVVSPKPSMMGPDKSNIPGGPQSGVGGPPPSVENAYGKSWGVCIGIDAYDHWPAIPLAAGDAATVKSALEKNKFDRVHLLTGKQATRKAIETLLAEELPAAVGSTDRVVVYFSGHGSTVKTRGGADKGFIIPADCPASDYFSSAISMGRIREIAQMIPAKHTLFVFDACFSDQSIAPAANAGLTGPRVIQQVAGEPGVWMIAACRSPERASDRDERGGLTSYFLAGMDGSADQNNDGIIFASELGAYVTSEFARTQPAHQAPLSANLGGSGEMMFRGTGKDRPKMDPKSADRASGMDASNNRRAKGRDEGRHTQAYTEPFVDLNIEMLPIPGGWIERSPDNEAYVDSFWMSRYEITVGQWKKFLDANGLSFDWSNNSFGAFPVAQSSPQDDHPMVNVSWHQATTFIEWLSSKTGKIYRLPTEAEWEYAAGAGRKNPYATATGDLGTNMANCQGCGSLWDGRQTAPVGSFPANPFGIHDMSGNVWEWCLDWHGEYPKGKQMNPVGPAEGAYRVSRGGSWNNPHDLIRTSHRGRIRPGYRGQYLGFRIVSPLLKTN